MEKPFNFQIYLANTKVVEHEKIFNDDNYYCYIVTLFTTFKHYL